MAIHKSNCLEHTDTTVWIKIFILCHVSRDRGNVVVEIFGLFVFCEQVALEMWILCHLWTWHMSRDKTIPAMHFQTQC